MTQTLSAVSADASVADGLDVAEGSPLLSLTRRSYQKTGAGDEQILDFLEVLYNPAHFQYSIFVDQVIFRIKMRLLVR